MDWLNVPYSVLCEGDLLIDLFQYTVRKKKKKLLFLGFKWSILQASKYKGIINQTRSDYGFVFFPCCLENKLWISCMLESLLMKSLAVVSLADYSVEWTEEKSITTT